MVMLLTDLEESLQLTDALKTALNEAIEAGVYLDESEAVAQAENAIVAFAVRTNSLVIFSPERKNNTTTQLHISFRYADDPENRKLKPGEVLWFDPKEVQLRGV